MATQTLEISPEEQIRQLQTEARDLPDRIAAARRAGDPEEMQRLRNRQEVLPALIKRAEILAVEAEILTADKQAQEHKAKANELFPAREQAEKEYREAEAKALQARNDHLRALQFAQNFGSRLSDLNYRKRQLEKELQAL